MQGDRDYPSKRRPLVLFAAGSAGPVVVAAALLGWSHAGGYGPVTGANLALSGVIAALALAIAIYVRGRRPDDPAARALSVVSSLVALAVAAPAGDVEVAFNASAPALLRMGVAACAVVLIFALPLSLLRLAMLFPTPIPMVARRATLPLMVALPLLGGALLAAGIFGGRSYVAGSGAALLVTATLGYLLAAPFVLIRQYRRATFEKKRQIRWPVLGIGAAVFLSIVVPSVAGSRISTTGGASQIQVGIDSKYLMLIPLTFAIALFKYRLLDIDVIIRRTVTYTIVTLTLLLLYAAGVAGAARILVSYGLQDETARLVTTALVAALFVPLRDRVQRRIDGRFYRRRYDDIESVRLLDEAIAAAADLQSLLAEAVGKLQQIFVCRAAAILVRDPRSSTLTVSSSIGLHEEAIRAARLEADSSATRSICNLDLHPETTPDEEAIRAMRARLLVPVRARGELIALVALGAKMSDEGYDSRDERVAAALAGRLAGAIENLRYRKLTAAESEWRTLDRVARLAFVAIAQNDHPAVAQVLADVRAAADAAGLKTSDERIEAAMARLIDHGAIARGVGGRVSVTQTNWLVLPDVLRPLQQVARDAGQRVGAYELLDRIGRGGMGEVYRATNVHDGSLAAVKILPPLEAGAEARKRFEREGALVAALSHPNIVRVLERGEHDGRLYIAMELIDGETLSAAIDSTAWSADRAVEMAVQVASALADLHGLGVVHRDVKSSNVMLTRGGRAVLLDFGLARGGDTSTLTAEAHIIGSLPYIAPEQLSGTPSDARADVWSFGILLYEALTGRRPWRETGQPSLMAEIGRGVTDWSRLESQIGLAPLTAIVRESLQVDPALRIRDGAELLRRLTLAARLILPPATFARGARPDVPTLTAVRGTV